MSETTVQNLVSESKPKRAPTGLKFTHDSNARNDIKMLKLRRKHGDVGYAYYFMILEVLREASDHKICLGDIDDLAYGLHVEASALKPVIDSCIDFELFEVELNYFYSPSLIDRVDAYLDRVETNRGNGLKGGRPKKTENPPNNPPVLDSKPTTKPSVCESESDPNIIQSNITQSNLIKSNLEKPNSDPPPLETELSRFVKSQLEDPDGQPWTQSNIFMTTGRRPTKKYPEIFLTDRELTDALMAFEASGIPRNRIGDVFKAVQGRLLTNRARGKSQALDSAFNWLVGWAKQEVLETLIKEQRLKNSQGVAA